MLSGVTDPFLDDFAATGTLLLFSYGGALSGGDVRDSCVLAADERICLITRCDYRDLPNTIGWL